MTATFERSYFVQHGTEDDTARARQAKEAERDHTERLAAVRVIAGLAADASEARTFYAMLGLTDDEIREARKPAAAAPVAASRRRGRVTAA